MNFIEVIFKKTILALPENIKLGCHALAYNVTELITAVKSFTVEAPSDIENGEGIGGFCPFATNLWKADKRKKVNYFSLTLSILWKSFKVNNINCWKAFYL